MNFDKQRGGQKKCNWLQAKGVSGPELSVHSTRYPTDLGRVRESV